MVQHWGGSTLNSQLRVTIQTVMVKSEHANAHIHPGWGDIDRYTL